MLNTFKTNNTMKRLLTIGLMLVSAFALTNCAEEIAAPVQDDITVDGNIENITPPEEEVDIPFEVFANFGESAETKTVNWGNGTYWYKKGQSTPDPNDPDKESDQISVFHYNHDKGQKKFTHNKPFTIHDVETGLFKGGLSNILGATNDWYFIYPYSSGYSIDSSSGSTLTVKGVQIGAQTQIQNGPNSKAHIVEEVSPMYGVKPGLSKDTNPDIAMKHMAAIVAIKVVNQGSGGNVVVKDVELRAKESIVGEFNITIPNSQNESVSFNATNCTNYSTAKLQIAENGLVIPRYKDNIEANGDGYATVYLAIKPFTAPAGSKLTIAINSSERTIELPDAINFVAGKVTTLRVPVGSLTRSTDSNVLTMTGASGNHVSFGTKDVDYTQKTICVNGKDITAYELGTASKTGLVTIQGTPKELIGKAPVSFYASSWNNTQGVMRVNRIYAEMDIFLVGKKVIDFNYEKLTQMMSAERITFTGLVKLEQQTINNDNYLTIIDEEVVHKDVSTAAIDSLLLRFDTAPNDPNDDKVPTYNGLKKALENPYGMDNEALTTAEIVLKKAAAAIDGTSFGESYGWLIKILQYAPRTAFNTLKDVHFRVELVTVPSGEGGATDNRVVVWGLHSGN